MFKRKKIYSIEEAISLIESLESKSARLPELLGFKSKDIQKNFRHLLLMCTSLTIVFTQYNLQDYAHLMLQKSQRADSNLMRYASASDKISKSRVIAFNNQAYAYYKRGNFPDSLKFLYKSEKIICSMRDLGIEDSYDLSIVVNMLSFLNLWKMHRYRESITHIEYAAQVVNSLLKGVRPSSYSRLNLMNLYALVVMGLAGLKVCVEDDWDKAFKICRDGAKRIDDDHISGKRMLDIMASSIQNKEKDWLMITQEYEKVFYVAVFIPFISSYAPVISIKELEHGSESNFPLDLKTEKRTGSSIPYRSFRVSPKRGGSHPRSRPWWERKELVTQVKKWEFRPVLSKLKPIKLQNEHIMLEFSSDKPTDPVNLVPIELKPNKPTALDFFN